MAAESALKAQVNRLELELHELKVKDESEQIFIGSYLLARLAQLNVSVSFGVIIGRWAY